MAARVVFRPLELWVDPVTDPRSVHSFSAAWSDTLGLLRREVEQLSPAVVPEVVLQVQAGEEWMRRDGGLRADARVRGPGVVVSFQSRFGPMRYVCDRFTGRSWGRRIEGWQANVRAIALGLEALRKVDRYGITGSGEQYVGWTAIDPAVNGEIRSLEQAAAFLLRFRTGQGEYRRDDLADRAVRVTLTRRAALKLHPDRGGDAAEFRHLQQATRLLDERFGETG